MIQKTAVDRPRLFYNTYKYCIRFHLHESHALRKLDHDHIESTLNIRQAWLARSINYGGSWRKQMETITPEDRKNLHAMCDFLLSLDHHKIMISSPYLSLYFNDTGIIDRVRNFQFPHQVNDPILIECKVYGREGYVYLGDPKHKLRTYLRNIKLDPGIAVSLRKYLKGQPEIRLGPALKSWTEDTRKNHCMDYYFIDHDDHSVISMMSLIVPNLTRKTVSIVRR